MPPIFQLTEHDLDPVAALPTTIAIGNSSADSAGIKTIYEMLMGIDRLTPNEMLRWNYTTQIVE